LLLSTLGTFEGVDEVERRKQQNLSAPRGDARGVTPSIRSFAQAIDRARQGIERIPVLRGARADLVDVMRALDEAEVAAIAVELDDPAQELGRFAEGAAAVNVPLLRSDLLLEEFQIYESRAAGADAVLLRPDVVGDALGRLAQAASSTHMAPCVVCRTPAEVERTLSLRGGVVVIQDLSLAPARRAHVVSLGPVAKGRIDAVLDRALGEAPDPAAAFRAALEQES
jgi:indole-3-glycerol phosphate synthase